MVILPDATVTCSPFKSTNTKRPLISSEHAQLTMRGTSAGREAAPVFLRLATPPGLGARPLMMELLPKMILGLAAAAPPAALAAAAGIAGGVSR